MSKITRGLIALVAAVSLFCGAVVADAAVGGKASSPSIESAISPSVTQPSATVRKVALGVSMADSRSLSAVDAFTASVGGHVPALWSVWSSWGGTDAAFPKSFFDGLQARGSVPMVIWQPTNPANDADSSYSYSSIINGSHDAYIRAWAKAAKAWGHTVILRFAHEMNGSWFPWGACRFNNSAPKFVTMWRHVWTIFHNVGATNVKFFWNPNSQAVHECGTYAALYPGDKYVTYAGFSAFNWNRNGTWKSMVQTFSQAVNALAKVTHKPLIVGETGTTNGRGRKAAWISTGYPAVYKAYPNISAIVYFDLDMTSVAQPNWLLTDPPAALAAYRKIVAQPKFQGMVK